MIIIGIDPGVNGGITAINTESNLEPDIHKMPATEADLASLLSLYQDDGETKAVAYLEKVNAHSFAFGSKGKSPRRVGMVSMSKFMQHYGTLRGILAALGIRREFVTPQTWQAALSCRSKGDKNITKAKAQELFPKLKFTHATADATLIAEYGRRKENAGK